MHLESIIAEKKKVASKGCTAPMVTFKFGFPIALFVAAVLVSSPSAGFDGAGDGDYLVLTPGARMLSNPLDGPKVLCKADHGIVDHIFKIMHQSGSSDSTGVNSLGQLITMATGAGGGGGAAGGGAVLHHGYKLAVASGNLEIMLLTSSKGFVSSKFLKQVMAPTIMRAVSGTNLFPGSLTAICDKMVNIWDSVSSSITPFGGGSDMLKAMQE